MVRKAISGNVNIYSNRLNCLQHVLKKVENIQQQAFWTHLSFMAVLYAANFTSFKSAERKNLENMKKMKMNVEDL